MLPALGDALIATAPFLDVRDVAYLSIATKAVRVLLAPAARLVANAREAADTLHALTGVSFAFALPSLEPEALKHAAEIFVGLPMLKRREYVAMETGMAPTEVIPWHFLSAADMLATLTLAQTLGGTKSVNKCQPPRLLFGAVISLAETAQSNRSLASATCPLGFEWVDGHAADSLQLGFQIFIPGASQEVPVRIEIDLELVSGGWADWAEDWSIHEGTLGASLDVGILLPSPSGKAHTIILSQSLGQKHAEVSPSHLVDAFFASLRAKESLVAVMSITKLRWEKPPPPWFPAEVEQITRLS